MNAWLDQFEFWRGLPAELQILIVSTVQIIVVLVPLILAYTAWSYWVFRGKVAHEGYH